MSTQNKALKRRIAELEAKLGNAEQADSHQSEPSRAELMETIQEQDKAIDAQARAMEVLDAKNRALEDEVAALKAAADKQAKKEAKAAAKAAEKAAAETQTPPSAEG
jgi:chromosome segregation ATPase